MIVMQTDKIHQAAFTAKERYIGRKMRSVLISIISVKLAVPNIRGPQKGNKTVYIKVSS